MNQPVDPARPGNVGAQASAAGAPAAQVPAQPASGQVVPASNNTAPPPAPVAPKPVQPVKPPQGQIFDRAPAQPARLRGRHFMVLLSFLLFVVGPIAVAGWYLYTRAADQYASYMGFSVRSETASAPTDLLGGLVDLSTNSSSDTDILYKFIQSHDLVTRVDEKLDLRAIWSKHAETDPVFSYRGEDTIEDLVENWERFVHVYYDDGMLDLRVNAFDPHDAQAVGKVIMDEGSRMVNDLSSLAREDAIKYAQADLDAAVERLKTARQAMTAFRNEHQIVDPSVDVAGQVGVMTSLQQQLAEALIQQGLLGSNAKKGDPRNEQAALRVRVIKEQIEEEKRKFGSETSNGTLLSDVVGQFEGLAVDRQFAEAAYVAALAAYDSARAEAERQSRYLAAYVRPTLSDAPEYPEREFLMALVAAVALVLWMVLVMVYYAMRDRR